MEQHNIVITHFASVILLYSNLCYGITWTASINFFELIKVIYVKPRKVTIILKLQKAKARGEGRISLISSPLSRVLFSLCTCRIGRYATRIIRRGAARRSRRHGNRVARTLAVVQRPPAVFLHMWTGHRCGLIGTTFLQCRPEFMIVWWSLIYCHGLLCSCDVLVSSVCIGCFFLMFIFNMYVCV